MSPIEAVFGLLVAVAGLTWVAHQLKVEYPILLVVGGLILGFIPGLPQVALRPDVVFLVFLPPLLYYEAFNSSIRDFKAVFRLILLSAVFLVVVTIAAVAAVTHAMVPDISWAAAVVFGAIVGPTDETAALAIVSRLRVPRRLIVLIKAESLFNDATSLVIFNVALGAAVTGTFSWALGFLHLFIDAIAGVAIGLAVGWIIAQLRARLDDVLLQNTVSFLSGYAAYYPADALHFSGVLSTIAAGLYLGQKSFTFTSPSVRVQIGAMRDITIFLINGMLFILVGLQLHPILNALASEKTALHPVAIAAIVSITVVVVRILWSFPSVYVPRFLSRAIRKNEPRPSWKNVVVASWTGVRGGVSLAAALAVPLTVASGAPFPHRQLIVFLTFAVILATLVIQGLTLPLLIRKLKIKPDDRDREEALARLRASRAAKAALERIARQPWADAALIKDIRGHLQAEMAHHRGRHEQTLTSQQRRDAANAARVRRALNNAREREILRLRNEGAINDETMRKIQHELDLEAVREGEP